MKLIDKCLAYAKGLAIILALMHVNAYGAGESIHVSTLASSSQSWDGATLPAYPATQPKVSVLKITIPPHTRLAMHLHPVINAGVLLSGQLIVETKAGQTLTLHAGDAIIETVNTAHFGHNDSDEPAEIIVFYAGTEDRPLSVVEAQ